MPFTFLFPVAEVDMCGYEDPPPKNSTTKRMVMLYALVLSRLADIEFILKDDATKAKAAKWGGGGLWTMSGVEDHL